MSYALVTVPEEEPISLEAAKDHLRVDITDDDALIGNKLQAIRRLFEEQYDLSILTQTWDLRLDAFPGGEITIAKYPLASVSSVNYTDADGSESEYTSANYLVDIYSRPGRIVLKSGFSWPATVLQEVNGVRVQFVSGYASLALVPSPIKAAILLLLGDLYELREEMLVSQSARISAQKLGIANLLMANHRGYNF